MFNIVGMRPLIIVRIKMQIFMAGIEIRGKSWFEFLLWINLNSRFPFLFFESVFPAAYTLRFRLPTFVQHKDLHILTGFVYYLIRFLTGSSCHLLFYCLTGNTRTYAYFRLSPYPLSGGASSRLCIFISMSDPISLSWSLVSNCNQQDLLTKLTLAVSYSDCFPIRQIYQSLIWHHFLNSS